MNYTEIATLDLPWAFANGVTVDEAFNWSEKYHPTKYFRAHGSEPMETDACWKVRLQEFVDANTALSQKEFAAKNIAVHSAPDTKVAFMLRNHSKLPSILYKKRIQTILDSENNAEFEITVE